MKEIYAKKVYEIIMEINDIPDYIANQEVISDLIRESYNLAMVTLRELTDPESGADKKDQSRRHTLEP